MDGTLVETEHYWGEALHALARRLGGTLSDEGRAATVGGSMRTSMAVLDADLGIRRTEDQWAADGRWVEDTTARLMETASSGGRGPPICWWPSGMRVSPPPW